MLGSRESCIQMKEYEVKNHEAIRQFGKHLREQNKIRLHMRYRRSLLNVPSFHQCSKLIARKYLS